MVGMFRCMVDYLTHRTKEDITNYDASSHPGGGVHVTPVVFVDGGRRYLVQWRVSMWLRGEWADVLGMDNSLNESGSTRFGYWWACRSCTMSAWF